MYVFNVGPCRSQEKFCSVVFTLQEGLWTAQCLDIGQNGPAKARSIVLYLEAPGLFLFLLLNSVDIVRGQRGRYVYVRPACVFARGERRGRALRVGKEEIAGPLFPPWLFAVSDPTAIKIAFFAERLGKLGKMELLMWVLTTLARRRESYWGSMSWWTWTMCLMIRTRVGSRSFKDG